MIASFRSFMTGLIDYAGLFPPARLDMAPAVAGYDRYLRSGDAWMLGRFICPAARLSEFAEALPGDFARQGAWELSVLIGDPGSAARSLDALAEQGRAVTELETRFEGRIRVAALELPVPAEAAPRADAFLRELGRALVAQGLGQRELYLEVPAGADPAHDPEVLDAIAALAADPPAGLGPVGAKFRCGGVTAEAFPSVERLAGIIAGSRQRGLPLKCTAGLHHPVRHQASEPPVMMHGFLNVFAAGLLAHAAAAQEPVLQACLAETDPAAFAFSAEGLTWGGHTVPAADIAAIRHQALPGFGSCSFDEPREDLQELGWLAPGAP